MLARFGLNGTSRVATCGFKKASLSTTAVKQIFNRPLKAKQRLQASQLTDYQYYEYLREEMASRLIDRLEDISRPFPFALELGSHTGIFGRKISEGDSLRSGAGGIGGIEKLLQTDMAIFGPQSEGAQVTDVNALFANAVGNKVKIANLTLDEEHISLPENTFDLVVSNSNLHWVNDIPKTFKQIQHVLKPDGAFVATMLGGATLQELRHCFFLADQERKGGTGQHASPMALASDVAALMQAANFSLPTVDVDTIQVGYPDLFSLMEHLYGMGESSAAFNRSLNVGKDTMMAAAAIYQELYGLDDGTIPATFEVIYMIGWKPDASQPKACRRGSADVSLRELNKLQ